MPIQLDQLCDSINTEQTVLFLGSGSSIPSGAPSVAAIRDHLATKFKIKQADLTLAELADIVERRRSRQILINAIRELFSELRPTGGLLSLPRFPWKSIYTTNYDNLVEESYKRADLPLSVYSSNFDFGIQDVPGALRLLKLHGTIDKDVADGTNHRLVVTETDYGLVEEYREYLFDSLKSDLSGADLIIVGHSLADPDIRDVINRARSISEKVGNVSTIYIFMYTQNAERAELYESRGMKVCFGGIDDLAAALTTYSSSGVSAPPDTSDPLAVSHLLQPITVDVQHSLTLPTTVSDMFNGWPASYADIAAGNTFQRSVVTSAERVLLNGDVFGVVLLGASGVGKTTAARQLLHNLVGRGYLAWEHKDEHRLLHDEWVDVANRLERQDKNGILFIDDCDAHLFEINALFESLASNNNTRLKIALAAARNRWNPRVKSPELFANSNTFVLEKLDTREIANLLRLIETNPSVGGLVDNSFMGFSVGEQRRRLVERCERDMFVCLKNIFASEKFDDIVLREYAQLAPEYREIYKIVAVLENSGVRVHRQLVIRLLMIDMNSISTVLSNLEGIVREYTVSERNGIYGWRGRHSTIMSIITEYKFAETESFETLYDRVIGALNPTFEIEVRTLRELCSVETGIRRISDLGRQNSLLAKMISVAPGERVPRHRLIRNLIDLERFEQAEAEIRLFSKDFQEDGPVFRYRIILALERARRAPGLLEEDRLVILNRARDLAINGVRRFSGNKSMLSTYCEVGLEMYRRTKDTGTFDDAIAKMKQAEEYVGDPDISRQIAYYERRMANG